MDVLYQSKLSALTGYEKTAEIKVNKFLQVFRKNSRKVSHFTKRTAEASAITGASAVD